MQPPQPKRRRFRFLQFSLRTLLLVTFFVAVACAYYLQPPSREELLAGGKLRLWRQVKVIEPGKTLQPSPTTGRQPYTQTVIPVSDVQLVNHGRWTLSDENGQTISTGYYQDGEQAGRWITYHSNGKKALEGTMRHGARVGVWKTWYASGQPQSETTYAPEPHRETYPHFHPAFIAYTAYRDGPARAWHANGQLRFAGSYATGQEEGIWTRYDESGRMRSRGAYREGKRHGEWTLRGDDSSPARTVRYIRGRTPEEVEQALATLTKRLQIDPQSGMRELRPDIHELESLGEPAVPALIELLSVPGKNRNRGVFALALARMGPAASSALPELRHLAAAGDAPDNVALLTAIFAIDPASRSELFEPLIAQAMNEQGPQGLEAVSIMYQADAARRIEMFDRMMSYGLDVPPELSHHVVKTLARLDDDLAAQLARHSTSGDPRVRRRVADVLVEFRSGLPEQGGLGRKTSWEDCQLLIDVLQGDRDPTVRAAAAVKQPVPGFGGCSGFF